MPRLRAWFSRLIGLFCKNSRDAEIAEELRQHVDLLTERNIAAGMSSSEARSAARKAFGGVQQIKEVAREQRVWRWADEFIQDVRFGARALELMVAGERPVTWPLVPSLNRVAVRPVVS